ncbi:MAG: hypothetical protein II902_08755 [Selenomonadaceae bacterium]|nr:hypothetical protein [Selenomonadaceae bacterium]
MTKKYRDGMFRDYFSDKRRLLSLCNLLTGEDATDPNEIIINTLDGVFFDSFKNDISCLFRGKFLVIVEHQSTVNENMPLRILFYAAELLKQYVDGRKGKLYAEQRITLPEPKFFVFYNGSKAEAAYREMRLSEAFGKRTCLEVVVEHYNINAGMNDEFVSRDADLNDYCTFINLVREFKAQGMDLEHAIAAALKYCLEHGIMVEYLLSRKKELASMLALEYDAELARQALLERGREEGREEREQEMVKGLLAINLSMKKIARVVGWTEEEVRKFAGAEKNS